MNRGDATYLEQAIVQTVRYFDLLGLPVTATQLWRCLVVPDPTSPVRWAGHHTFSLPQITTALRTSPWLEQHITTRWGYYCLVGREALVEQRLSRHAIAQQKWKILRRAGRWLAWVPLVDMLAASGSLALYNTKPSSDLDVLIVARSRRIWTARLLLLLVAELQGRRRRHWDQAAPDKLCFNHYLTTTSLAVAPEIRNVYTAVQYVHLAPLVGEATHQQFMAANAAWLKRYVMYHERPVRDSVGPAVESWRARIKRQLEALLLEPVGSVIERAAERLQRRAIVRHRQPGQGGRIVVSRAELAFHPHSKVEGILHEFAQELGQQRLL